MVSLQWNLLTVIFLGAFTHKTTNTCLGKKTLGLSKQATTHALNCFLSVFVCARWGTERLEGKCGYHGKVE